MSADTLKRLRALPKVELHCHLEGALRPETLWEFHCRQKHSLYPNFEALKTACTIPEGERPGFLQFLARFPALRFHYGGMKEVERLAAEAVEDAAADGVVHFEIRFSPVFLARRTRTDDVVSDQLVEEAAHAVVESAQSEARKRGMSVAFILLLARHMGRDVNRPAAQLIERSAGKHFAALDLAGEEAYPAAEFSDWFSQWKQSGRGLTIHAGEDPNGPGAHNVSEALSFQSDRIGHGVRAVESEALVNDLARKQIVLEMCPTSNIQTCACSDFSKHPLKGLLARGVKATINTDDPAISQTTLSQEYLRAKEDCGLSWAELRQCALNAAEGAFLPCAEKQALVEKIRDAWSAF